MTHKQKPNDECCPKFDPALWQEKEVTWTDKQFIKESIPLFFHMPLPWMVGKSVARMWKKIKDAKADPDMKDFLWLAYDPSPWKGEYYMTATKEVPNAENVILSGTFMTKVFDGPFNAVPKWMKIMDKYVADKGKKVKKYYFYYTTCPKCAKKYGHNYVVAFAQVD